MANEKRLIDANKVINAMQKCIDDAPFAKGTITYSSFEAIIECLKQEPTVDAVEVVRCRDCVNYCGFEHCKNGICDVDSVSKRAVYQDDFCSHGERREGE